MRRSWHCCSPILRPESAALGEDDRGYTPLHVAAGKIPFAGGRRAEPDCGAPACPRSITRRSKGFSRTNSPASCSRGRQYQHRGAAARSQSSHSSCAGLEDEECVTRRSWVRGWGDCWSFCLMRRQRLTQLIKTKPPRST